MAEISEIKKRLRTARADRSEVESYIDTAFRYSIPQRRVYLEAQNRMKPNAEVYDSTAILGVQRFATKLQSMLVPTSQTWMRLKGGSDYSKEDRTSPESAERQMMYDDATETFFEELKHSNFDTQVAESFQDLSVTTGALIINPSPLGSKSAFTFKAVPISELYVENPSDGHIRTSFREYVITIEQLTRTYEGAVLSEEHERMLKEDPNTKITIVESCIYRTKEDWSEVDVVEIKSNHTFVSSTEPESPWVIFRENVVAGSALGFGRVLRVLPDIKTVNKIKELLLQGGSIAVSGTFTAHDDGVLNPYNVRLRAGAVIPVNSNDVRNPSIARLDTPTNFDWGNMEITSLQATINDVLLSNPMGDIENAPVRSATEIAARNRDLFDSMSSSFGRMQIEFVSPVIKRCVYLLQQAGRIDESLVLDGRNTTFDFISPLTRLQQSADIENVLEWISVVGTMGEEVAQRTINMEQVPAWLGEKYSVPQELIKTPEAQVAQVETGMELDAQAIQQGLEPTDAGSRGPATAGGMGGLDSLYG